MSFDLIETQEIEILQSSFGLTWMTHDGSIWGL